MKVFILAIVLAWLQIYVHAAELTVGTGKMYATIQEAVDVAQAGDTVMVDPGTYNETVSTQRAGAQSQEITIESMAYLGATIQRPFLVSHDYVIVRGFVFSNIDVADNQGCLTIKDASNVGLEWCSFVNNMPLGQDSSVVRVENASAANIRANIFKSNVFGLLVDTSGSSLHVVEGRDQQIVGNQFDDAEVDVARRYCLRVESVSDATFRHNGVSRLGFPEIAGALFAESTNLRIIDNYFGAPVHFADISGANEDEGHRFEDNTVSMNEQPMRGPNVALQTSNSRTLNNMRIINNLLVLCGETQWLCADASCGGAGGGLTNSRVADTVWSDEPDCRNSSVTSTGGNTLVQNIPEPESQALSFDALTGCNRLSGARGAQSDVSRLPFVSCENAANQLFPFPYPTQPPTPAPSVAVGTPAPTPAMTSMEIVPETAPATPPPTPLPPATLPPTTAAGNATEPSANTESSPSSLGVAPAPEPSDDGVSIYVILIIIGPLVLCSVIIAIMTCIAFFIRHKKIKELKGSGGTRMEETW